jgi:hypothetical protein
VNENSRNLKLEQNRFDFFVDFYRFHTEFKLHPGMVYLWLPALAEHFNLDREGKAWLTWLNGNTQNPVTTYLLLEQAPRLADYEKAIKFYESYAPMLSWDTDRRHQKFKFVEATRTWVANYADDCGEAWRKAERHGWRTLWDYSYGQPFMGRLSAWSMAEYAFILGLHKGEPDDLLLEDKNSLSHRNGLRILNGGEIDTVPWHKDSSSKVEARALNDLGNLVLNQDKKFHRWTLESALCAYKSFHKPNRRYPGVYADMAYYRIQYAEERFGKQFSVLWNALRTLPDYLQLERSPLDPGLCSAKQNHYLKYGETVTMGRWIPKYFSEFDRNVDKGYYV